MLDKMQNKGYDKNIIQNKKPMEIRQFKDLPLDSYFIFKGKIPVPHKTKAPIVFVKKSKTIIRQFGEKEEIKFLKRSYLCDFLGQDINDIAPDYFINLI